jgi:hypothetical protein
VATDLAEPSDVVVTGDGAVVVVESAGHRLTRIALSATSRDGGRMRTERPVTDLQEGTVVLDVIFEPAPGQKLDDSFGSPLRLEVSASPPELLVEGGGVTNGALRRVLRLASGAGVLQVIAQAATCDIDAEYPACHLTRQDWGVPVRISDNGAGRLPLVLRGLENGSLPSEPTVS